jgi:hypothetical protein
MRSRYNWAFGMCHMGSLQLAARATRSELAPFCQMLHQRWRDANLWLIVQRKYGDRIRANSTLPSGTPAV